VVVHVGRVASLRYRVGRMSNRFRFGVAGLGLVLLIGGIAVASSSGARHITLPPTPPTPTTFVSSAPPLHLSFGAPVPVSAGSALPKQTCPIQSATPPVGVGSLPVRICIPGISVNASIIQLGLNQDRSVQVPSLRNVGDAGWYKYSPEPGLNGPTIILGHIDSAKYGKGVFFYLGKLKGGDLVNIARADGAVATFRIDTVAEYPKKAFPTQKIYGDTAGPTIRLITCGGRFDASTGNYLDNIVAYGSLISVA